MNERIKLLERQCWQSTQTEPYALFDVKKFAELIVAECTKILADNSEFRGCVIISKHFGVEE